MRNAFVKTITELAENDSSVMLVIGDTGYGAFEDFEARFPKQFVNVGIAEQQFIGYSAGLALSGMRVFAYNVCSLMSRAMEQIRLELSYQKAPVVLVGVGGGFWYGTGGPTHHAVEDISQFRALPNMSIICPADPVETEAVTREAIVSGEPCYIRICKNNDPVLHTRPVILKIGKATEMRSGSEISLIATGGMVREALAAAELLEESGVSAQVISMHTVKPLDKAAVIECSKTHRALFTLEENTIVGGLGSAVAEVLLESGNRPKHFKRFGFPDCFAPVTGTRDYLNALYGLNPESIADEIKKIINGVS